MPAENLNGTTALMWAAEQGHAARRSLLLENGQASTPNPRSFSRSGETAWDFARAARDGQIPTETLGGLTALLFAARQGSLDTVRILLASGADGRLGGCGRQQPVLVAVQNGYYEIARFLLDHGADPNQANLKNWTPIYLAVANRDALTTAVPSPGNEGRRRLHPIAAR